MWFFSDILGAALMAFFSWLWSGVVFTFQIILSAFIPACRRQLEEEWRTEGGTLWLFARITSAITAFGSLTAIMILNRG